jgi:hypothetical protein
MTAKTSGYHGGFFILQKTKRLVAFYNLSFISLI